MRKTTILIGLAALLLSGGCTMIPRYQRPDSPVPASLPGTPLTADAPAGDLAWQKFFTGKNLQSLIELALSHNRDLRIAALNVEKLQAAYRIQRAGLLPGLSATAGAENYRVPERMTSDDQGYNVAQYSIRGAVSWEIDLFGRLRSLRKKALNQFLASDQARNATRISLLAAVADSYLNLAADREILKLAQATLEAQKASYELIRQSRDAGLSSDLSLYQSQSQVEAARADVARYSGLVALDRNALNLLVGTAVGDELLPDGLTAITELQDISTGLESDILLRRPDIRAAEFQLQSVNANIGAARAAFFPRISLTAAIGTVAPELSSLFETGTGSWTFAPQIVQPLFNGGSLLANLKAAKVDRDIAVAQYEKSIQTAFREVSDALARRTALVEQLAAQQSLVEALERSYNLSSARFNEGVDSYLGVLVSQRSFYDGQRALIATRLARLSNQVALYKVLGGGI